MKIAIICFWDRTATPYLRKYEIFLKKLGITYDVIFWNRTNAVPANISPNEIYISRSIGSTRFSKIYAFLMWRSEIKKIINCDEYTFLIVLSTYPAVFLLDILLFKFKGRYIFDIRDYTLERFLIYKKLIMKIVDSSRLSTVSSRGYFKWLDEHDKIYLNHNITHSDYSSAKQIYFHSGPVNITLVGNVRLDLQTKSFLISLKNSQKFVFGFIGRQISNCNIADFCSGHKIDNYFVKGEFAWREKANIYAGVDLINAVYANSKNSQKMSYGDSTPLPNRIYDAAIFRCPIIASRGTYLAEIVSKYNLGIAINGFDSDIEKKLEEYLNSFNKEQFELGCNMFLAEVREEECLLNTKLNEIFAS